MGIPKLLFNDSSLESASSRLVKRAGSMFCLVLRFLSKLIEVYGKHAGRGSQSCTIVLR